MADNVKLSTFIDLFAGIGGFRHATQHFDLKCVYSNDYDKYACQTYSSNWGDIEEKDIHEVTVEEIPSFDVLFAGFPCQPFSIAGVSKKNSLGRKHGFEDKKQGNLFFEIIRIAKHHRPKIMFLENVKNLHSHDKGNTWKVIKSHLEDLGYTVFANVIDAKNYVPQHRERIFIICFDKKAFPNIHFTFPSAPEKRAITLGDVLEDSVPEKYTLSDKLWSYLQKHKEKSSAKGNGFGFGLVDPTKDEYTRTLSARYYKDGSEILIFQEGRNPRRLTPRECARLQGFSEDFVIPVSDAQAYRQFGNSVAVPAIRDTIEKILSTVQSYSEGGSRSTEISLF